MKRFTLTQLLLLVTWCAIACVPLSRLVTKPPYQGETHDIAGMTFYDFQRVGDRMLTTRYQDAVPDSPEWSPHEANPPVSARVALGIADQLRRDRLRGNKDWKWGLDSITLYPLEAANNKWCWCVKFRATLGRGSGPEFSAYILMNGKAILPKLEKDLWMYGIVVDDPQEHSAEQQRKSLPP